MALRAARALVRAQARNTWNRVARESGAAGPVTSALLMVFVALILLIPSSLVLLAGRGVGAQLTVDPDRTALLRWNAFQAMFTLGFALCGSLRHRPSFRFRDVGWLPVPPAQMLAAEVPSALFEVFPILAIAGIVFSNLGFAIVRPDLAPWLVVMSLQGMAAMVAVVLLAASLRRLVIKRRAWIVPVVLIAAGYMAWFMAGGLRPLVRGWGAAIVRWLPGSQGYEGILEIAGGATGAGVTRIALALGATGVLVWVAAASMQREMAAEAARLRWRSAETVRSFRSPAVAIAWLFFKQLLDAKISRIALFTPLLLTVCMAVPVWAVRQAVAQDRVIPDDLVALTGRLEAIPMLAAFLFLIVTVNAQIWMNQFGWDGSGVRTLLLQPIDMRDTLLGKTLGLFGFAALQALIGVLPVLWAFPPTAAQVVVVVTGAGSAMIASMAFGHLVSARFPRRVTADSTQGLPLFLSWIPFASLVLTGGVVAIVHAIAGEVAPGSEPVALTLLLVLVAGAYYLVLPGIGRQVATEKERLLQMA